MNKYLSLGLAFLLLACQKKVEKIKPTRQDITESVYASGVIKSKHQYQAYANVNGPIQDIFVVEGDTVKVGSPLFSIFNSTARLNTGNALLSAELADINANQSRLNELKLNIDLASNKMVNDSILLGRQRKLWEQKIGSQQDLEQRELAYENSQTNYRAAILRYDDLKRQIGISSRQSKNNLQISETIEGDFVVKSQINGRVYAILKEKGEVINVQMPLAVLGDAHDFTLELLVDEYDVARILPGQQVFLTMDSYRGEVFEAQVQRIVPIMNERSKSFTVEAVFTRKPPILYPNLTTEANIVIQIKKNVLTLPRKFLIDDQFVIKKGGEKVAVKVGLKDYQKAEILSGLSETDEVQLP